MFFPVWCFMLYFSLSEAILNNNSSSCVSFLVNAPKDLETIKENCGAFKLGEDFNASKKIDLLISNDISEDFLFEILREALNKTIKINIFYKPKSFEDPPTNTKILSFATDGYFIDLSKKRVNYEYVVKNESASGHYKHKLNFFDPTKLMVIKINGDVDNLQVMSPSGKKLLPNRIINLKNLTFLTLKVNQNGPWTLSFDAKKRAYVNIIKEDALQQTQMLHQVRHKRFTSSNNIQRSLPQITIEMGSNSKLVTTPYTSATIYFEVTNNQEQADSVGFICTDTKGLLQNINLGSANIQPNQTITVTVQLSGALSSGNYDIVTFSTTKYNAKKIAYLYVNEGESDSTPPEIWHSLITDCANVESSNCQSKTWEVNIFARDKETGLLQFFSQPRGINFDNNNFISGSKEEITGHYTANCCNSKLIVTAVDLRGNKNILEVNSYEESAPLNAGFASAIALGVILLIVIIIIIIYFVIRQKQKGSLDLPTYRGPSGSRTPL